MFKGFDSKWLVMAAVALALTACDRPSDSAWMNRGGPESLLDVSSEAVSLNIATKKDVDALNRWIAGDAPSRAELQCDMTNKNCKDAARVLQKKGVQVTNTPSPANTATLVYERILARDCNQRFREPKGELYNPPSPALGCSVAANTVQHVSDKSVFINPAISDEPLATSGVAAIHRMNAPQTQQPTTYDVSRSVVSDAKTD